jgi:hypothetical protein
LTSSIKNTCLNDGIVLIIIQGDGSILTRFGDGMGRVGFLGKLQGLRTGGFSACFSVCNGV